MIEFPSVQQSSHTDSQNFYLLESCLSTLCALKFWTSTGLTWQFNLIQDLMDFFIQTTWENSVPVWTHWANGNPKVSTILNQIYGSLEITKLFSVVLQVHQQFVKDTKSSQNSSQPQDQYLFYHNLVNNKNLNTAIFHCFIKIVSNETALNFKKRFSILNTVRKFVTFIQDSANLAQGVGCWWNYNTLEEGSNFSSSSSTFITSHYALKIFELLHQWTNTQVNNAFLDTQNIVPPILDSLTKICRIQVDSTQITYPLINTMISNSVCFSGG